MKYNIQHSKDTVSKAIRMGLNNILLGEKLTHTKENLLQDAALCSGKGKTSKQNTYTTVELVEATVVRDFRQQWKSLSGFCLHDCQYPCPKLVS